MIVLLPAVSRGARTNQHLLLLQLEPAS